ncbi:MAG: glycosyl hydrolase family 28-related protein [Bacteroidota bacterium]|nr:glycosyl hydrolase family 28-related protein [Bacteroidota bacterium]
MKIHSKRFQCIAAWSLFLCLTICPVKAGAVTITVPIGGNIQNAVNQINAQGGGVVNLVAGTYTLTSTLLMKSNVALNGAGMTSTIIQIADTFNVIEDASEGLKNVTIQNLKVVGKHSTNCYGILIQAGTTYHSHIQLINVEVTGAGMGAHFKRINGLTITRCNFHQNGSADQIGYYHNLYIRSCNTVYVADSYMNNSTSANGLNVSYCNNVTISNCTANHNYFRGMRAADTNGFAVLNCVMNSNGDVGLLANAEVTPTININWYQCAASGNKHGGVKAIAGVTGSLTGCRAFENTGFNYSISDAIVSADNH